MKGGAWLFAAIGAVILVVLFLAFKPQPPAAPEATGPAAAPAAAPAVDAAAPGFDTHEVTLEVRDGRLASGPTVIRIRQDDVLILSIVADRADELHIHGYDLHVPVDPQAPAVVRLKADRSGRFDYELHEAHLQLGALEVQPR